MNYFSNFLATPLKFSNISINGEMITDFGSTKWLSNCDWRWPSGQKQSVRSWTMCEYWQLLQQFVILRTCNKTSRTLNCPFSHLQNIVKILNLYIILLCTQLYHFFPVSIHYSIACYIIYRQSPVKTPDIKTLK